jgi:outer membrane protein
MYPSLRLSTGMDRTYTRIGNENSDPMISRSLTPYGNLSLSYTFYNGGNRRSDIQIARINEEISEVETEEMVHSLTNQLMNVHDYYNVRKILLTLASENLVAAELNLRIADEKFRTGAINSFNYRDIQLIYLNAALDRLEAIFNLVESRTELTRMTGGFLSPDEGPSN